MPHVASLAPAILLAVAQKTFTRLANVAAMTNGASSPADHADCRKSTWQEPDQSAVSLLPGIVGRYRIVALRKRMKLSRRKFAGRFGLDVRTIQDREQGRKIPDRAARGLLTVIGLTPSGCGSMTSPIDHMKRHVEAMYWTIWRHRRNAGRLLCGLDTMERGRGQRSAAHALHGMQGLHMIAFPGFSRMFACGNRQTHEP